jgi:hypothetical protein
MKYKVTTLDHNVLNKAWYAYLERERDRLGKLTEHEIDGLRYNMPYGSYSFTRRGNKAQRFEQWLFTHGAEVRKNAGKYQLEFADESQATMFALKWI